MAGSTASLGHRLRARKEQNSPVFQGGGATSASKGSRSTAWTGTKARWPPLATGSACSSGGITNIFGEQPECSQADPGGTASTGHARRTCCPTSRTTSPSGLSVLSSNIHTSWPATSCNNKPIKGGNISTTLPQPEPGASSSPPVPPSSSQYCQEESSPKKKEDKVRRKKAYKSQEDNLPDPEENSLLPGKAQMTHHELSGVSQESATLETSSAFSTSTLQGAEKRGGVYMVQGE